MKTKAKYALLPSSSSSTPTNRVRQGDPNTILEKMITSIVAAKNYSPIVRERPGVSYTSKWSRPTASSPGQFSTLSDEKPPAEIKKSTPPAIPPTDGELYAAFPSAVKRLLKDYRELTCSPTPGISARPLESNVREWHCNIGAPDGSSSSLLQDVQLHVTLRFPTTYPMAPPALILSTHLPHPNVMPNGNNSWMICLDILDAADTIPWSGWSPSYSVKTLLIQLQACLLDPLNLIAGEDLNFALNRVRKFECQGCGHSHSSPSPSLPTKEDLENASTKVVARPRPIPTFKPAAESSAKSLGVKGETQGGGDDKWTTIGSKKATRASKPDVPSPETKEKRSTPVKWNPKTTVETMLAVSDRRMKDLQKDWDAIHREREEEHRQSQPERTKQESTASGLASLPQELLVKVLANASLTDRDVRNAAATCRDMQEVCEDGHLWRSVFSRTHSASQWTAEKMSEWKQAFLLQSNRIGEDLCCFVTKQTIDEDVIGIPIVFTRNPKTRKIDYIDSTFDLISRKAYFNEEIRTTVWKTSFQEWLPLYLTEDHFLKALPDIKRFIVKMCSQWETRTFQPEMVLEVLPRMQNTLIVLMCDKGIAVSERAIAGYFQLRRLLCAFIDLYPRLRDKIEQKIADATGLERARTKDALPSLGDFIPLLAVSEKFSWKQAKVRDSILAETFDRKVLWLCKKYPELAKIDAPAAGAPAVDHDRMKKTFEAGKVSLRLLMFHVQMLSVLRPANDDMAPSTGSEFDGLYGFPARSIVAELQAKIKAIMKVHYWPSFFAACRVDPVPSPAAVTAKLRAAVRASLRKNYHSKNTDFSRIHRSGVSTILLRGESYSAPPNLKNVCLQETWRWTNGHSLYLDASCSVFNFSGKNVCNIDYSTTTNPNGSIVHSGDELDEVKREGHHKIDIDLTELPDDVKALVFAITGFTTPLAAVQQPYVRFTDPATDHELCRFNFDTQDQAQLALRRSLIMCALWRPVASKKVGGWQVTALGSLGDGCVSNYGPLLKDMRAIVRSL